MDQGRFRSAPTKHFLREIQHAEAEKSLGKVFYSVNVLVYKGNH